MVEPRTPETLVLTSGHVNTSDHDYQEKWLDRLATVPRDGVAAVFPHSLLLAGAGVSAVAPCHLFPNNAEEWEQRVAARARKPSVAKRKKRDPVAAKGYRANAKEKELKIALRLHNLTRRRHELEQVVERANKCLGVLAVRYVQRVWCSGCASWMCACVYMPTRATLIHVFPFSL